MSYFSNKAYAMAVANKLVMTQRGLSCQCLYQKGNFESAQHIVVDGNLMNVVITYRYPVFLQTGDLLRVFIA